MEKYNILKSYIVRAGYTQSSLASQVDMSRSSMTLKINNKSPFSVLNSKKMSYFIKKYICYTCKLY